MGTDLRYLEDTKKFEANAKILSVENGDAGGQILILDETIFYPQGGGQPTDVGVVEKDEARFEVSRVSFHDGIVYHAGSIKLGDLQAGDMVHLVIDGERRMRHARLHTGGHLVMTAVDRLLGFPAVKGYHFPDGPYVEFSGVVDPDDRDGVVSKLQNELETLIAADSEVTAEFVGIAELREQGVYIPAEIPSGKPTRVVITAGYKSPCGGTHVGHLGELTGLRIKGLKNKSGKLRVSYTFDGE